MNILEEMHQFEKQYGKNLQSGGLDWQYYRLGRGIPILWLTGGLRRTALGFSFLEQLSKKHTVIAPDYPATHTIEEFIEAFDAILKTEKVEHFILAGQSYGSLLAQVYLARHPQMVETLVISSGGPADYSRIWLAADYLAVALVRLLPDKSARKFFLKGLLNVLSPGAGEQSEWPDIVRHLVMNEMTHADLVSHFAVTADAIKKQIVCPEAFENWRGRVIILSATNDPTQSSRDFPRYERLFGRPIEIVDLGDLGHAALLYKPGRFVEILEQALVED
jgi:pimeloyl-ACP methyl ester carboxylesterase